MPIEYDICKKKLFLLYPRKHNEDTSVHITKFLLPEWGKGAIPGQYQEASKIFKAKMKFERKEKWRRLKRKDIAVQPQNFL